MVTHMVDNFNEFDEFDEMNDFDVDFTEKDRSRGDRRKASIKARNKRHRKRDELKKANKLKKISKNRYVGDDKLGDIPKFSHRDLKRMEFIESSSDFYYEEDE